MKRITQLIESNEPVKWLFYGDSITHGAYHTFGFRDYTEHFDERIRYEMGRGTDVIINTAISGHTTRELLNGFDWRVRQFAPQIVFIMIGMNDCEESRGISSDEFQQNLLQLCEQLKEINALPVLQTTCPILPGTTPGREPHFANYMNIIREVANQNVLPLIDHLAFWEENRAKHYYWMHDCIHPNAHGHLVFAHALFRVIGIYNDNSHICRFFVP